MATIYVSKEVGASDANNGLSTLLPKLTLAAAETAAAVNDTILLRRGDTWVGENLQIADSGRVVGAYGSGTDPVIDNRTILSTANEGSNIWSSANSLRGLWMMNEATAASRADSSGNGNTLTDTNSVAQQVYGPRQSAYSAGFVRASNQKLQIADASCSANFPCKGTNAETAITWGAWIHPDTIPGAATRYNIMRKGAEYDLYFENQRIYALTYNGGAYPVGVTDANVTTPDVWYHVAGRVSTVTGFVEIFLNGVKQTTKGTGVTTIQGIGDPFVIGANGTDNTANFDGWISEAFVYQRALSDAEITAISQSPPVWVFRDGTYGTLKRSRSLLASNGDYFYGGGAVYQYSTTTPATTVVNVSASPGLAGIISANQINTVTIQDLAIIGAPDCGIRSVAVAAPIATQTISRCTISYCGAHGIEFFGNDTTNKVTGVTVTGCTVSNTGQHGICFLFTVQDSLITGCNVSFAGMYPLEASSYVGGYHGITQYSQSGTNRPSNNIVENCIVTQVAAASTDINAKYGSGTGIQCDDFTNLSTVRGCTAYNNGGIGLVVNNNTSNTLLRCLSYGNLQQGINVQGGATGVLIYHCVSALNTTEGIAVNNGTTVKNCISYENGAAYELEGINFSTFTSDYNCWFRTAGGAYMGYNGSAYTFANYVIASGKDTHSVGTDPKFVDVANRSFGLKAASPCRNTGVVIANINDGGGGSVRYSESAPDMGAIEFAVGQGAVPVGWGRPITAFLVISQTTVYPGTIIIEPGQTELRASQND
jgi:hypothetical protein